MKVRYIKCNILDFIPSSYRGYIQNREYLLTQNAVKYIFQISSGEITINNQTDFTDQDYMLSILDSRITIDGMIIKDTQITLDFISIVQSNATISNVNIQNISSNDNNGIFVTISSIALFENIQYVNSTLEFITSSFSTLSVNGLWSGGTSGAKTLIYARSCTIPQLDNIVLDTIITTSNLIQVIDSTVTVMKDNMLKNIPYTPISFKRSSISEIRNITVQNCTSGLFIGRTVINLLTLSKFEKCGGTTIMKGAALEIEKSNLTITESIFQENIASRGAAINIECAVNSQCSNSIINNTFTLNSATEKGGAILYNMNRPVFENNTFINNSALYGSNIASYATRIINMEDFLTKIEISEIASGMSYNKILKLALKDFDNQTMVLEHSNIAKISPITANASIEGIDYGKFRNGIATLQGLAFVSNPGTKNVEFSITSKAIDTTIISQILATTPEELKAYSTSLTANFRYCQPGEIEEKGK